LARSTFRLGPKKSGMGMTGNECEESSNTATERPDFQK
jgi:hypothetical protein